jgi:hypothetical protein
MVTIADFHEALLNAEEEIKFAELSIDSLASVEDDVRASISQPRGVVLPAINELRYAAKHFSSAVQEGVAGEDQQEHLRRAIRHCVRAKLDALRAVVLFFARDFYRFSDDYRLLDIAAEDRDKLNEYRQKIQDVLSMLSKARSQDTDEDCESLKAAIGELQKSYLEVSKYRGVFNWLLSKMDKHDKDSTWQWKVGIVVAIILALVALFRS